MVIYHKNLDVYRLALEFVKLAGEIAQKIPRGQGQLADQLRRASGSIAYNIGEGAGEFSRGDKVRFYRIALRSATESSTIIDIVLNFSFIDQGTHQAADHLAERIIKMLTKLIHYHSENHIYNIAGMRQREREPLR